MSNKRSDSYEELLTDQKFPNLSTSVHKPPLRIPIIVFTNNRKLRLAKHEFLVPRQLKVAHLTATLRRSIVLDADSTVYLYSKSHMLKQDKMLSEIYEAYRDDDGFLYITVSDIPVLG